MWQTKCEIFFHNCLLKRGLNRPFYPKKYILKDCLKYIYCDTTDVKFTSTENCSVKRYNEIEASGSILHFSLY